LVVLCFILVLFYSPFFFGPCDGRDGPECAGDKAPAREKRKEKSQFDEPCGIELLVQLLVYIGPARIKIYIIQESCWTVFAVAQQKLTV
jgi:hypothetical protein